MSYAFHLVFGVALVGCAAESSISTTTTSSAEVRRANVVGVHAALSDITQAQCARAQACGAIPARGVYRDADYCTDDLDTTTRADLLGRGCDGVDGARLAACIDAIRHEECASENFTERAPAVCQSAWLCR